MIEQQYIQYDDLPERFEQVRDFRNVGVNNPVLIPSGHRVMNDGCRKFGSFIPYGRMLKKHIMTICRLKNYEVLTWECPIERAVIIMFKNDKSTTEQIKYIHSFGKD